jgi:alpha/beta superfamily hydrolase
VPQPAIDRAISLETADGVVLEALLQTPPGARHLVVWCHPHPLFGGSMNAPLMNSVSDALVGDGLGVLRFDFRGVGRSTGAHGHGLDEVEDVAAAVEFALGRSDEVTLAGWSFGALVGLRYLQRQQSNRRFVGVAPPVTDAPEFDGFDGSACTLVLGTRDQVVDLEIARAFAAKVGADVIEVATDHFFVGKSGPVIAAISG